MKPPRPSFHDRENESGYKINAKRIGAINASTAYRLGPQNMEISDMIFLELLLSFNYFSVSRDYRQNFKLLLLVLIVNFD